MSDISNNETEIIEETEEDELSYSELYSTALLNGEVIITIAIEDEEKTKTGIKNYKSKMNQKLKDDNLAIDSSIISFASRTSTEFEGCVDLSILVQKRGTVKIKAMKIPEQEIPD
jgi:hypothetical protein